MQIVKTKSPISKSEKDEYLATHKQKIIEASPIVDLNRSTLIAYNQLDANVTQSVAEDALQRLDIKIVGEDEKLLDKLKSQLLVTSQK